MLMALFFPLRDLSDFNFVVMPRGYALAAFWSGTVAAVSFLMLIQGVMRLGPCH